MQHRCLRRQESSESSDHNGYCLRADHGPTPSISNTNPETGRVRAGSRETRSGRQFGRSIGGYCGGRWSDRMSFWGCHTATCQIRYFDHGILTSMYMRRSTHDISIQCHKDFTQEVLHQVIEFMKSPIISLPLLLGDSYPQLI
ncbi:hypothetical protein Ancab_008459 [Ancistrocladus abbreviatus]